MGGGRPAITNDANLKLLHARECGGCLKFQDPKFRKNQFVFVEIENGTSVYRHKAAWYLALLALKENDLAACKVYLKKLPNNADDYEKAQKLLNKLN